MEATKKITVHLPDNLLERAREATGRGITETVRQGLQLVAAGDAYKRLRELRGKENIELELSTLRQDRD